MHDKSSYLNDFYSFTITAFEHPHITWYPEMRVPKIVEILFLMP